MDKIPGKECAGGLKRAIVIGGGLAGCEAAWTLSRKGIGVTLFEMKPVKFSPVHKSNHLAELVCSNSLRSDSLSNAAGLLKEELGILDSLIIRAARASSLPAGSSLAVDREEFSSRVTEELTGTGGVEIVRKEITELPVEQMVPVILASGPLTSEPLAESLCQLTEQKHLYFYDAIAPIVEASSIDGEKIFKASRYQEGEGHYLNCPMTGEEYRCFWEALRSAKKVELREFEEIPYFEGCLPIEVLADRGPETLAFGPMKPVGLVDPRTGKRPYAVVQLRQENRYASLYNIVGFQTKLTYPEQNRVFRMIPGLEQAEFVRYGSIHRNTYVNAPTVLEKNLQLKNSPGIWLAGQITGVEGYIESTAIGLLAGLAAAYSLLDCAFSPPPETTAIGSLLRYLWNADPRYFQPMKINFGLLPEINNVRGKKEKRRHLAQRAIRDLMEWNKEEGTFPSAGQ